MFKFFAFKFCFIFIFSCCIWFISLKEISLEKGIRKKEEIMAEVKIDNELHKRIKKVIDKGENRFDFPTVKSFVDKAVLKMLKTLENK